MYGPPVTTMLDRHVSGKQYAQGYAFSIGYYPNVFFKKMSW